MKTLLPRLLPGERARFVTLGLLLFINSLVQESNEVVATSGFVSNVGVKQVPWLWTVEYLLVILVSGAYSLVVDRTKRERLTIALSLVFSLLYSLLYVLFVREVPVYRYMTVAMLMVGIGWTVIEYQLLVSASHLKPAALQAFYGWFKVAVPLVLLIVQSVVASWLLNRLGSRHVFTVLPAVLLFSLLLTMLVPGLVGVAAGVYLVRVTTQGVDESSRQSFLGLVPDERRGRVSAFVEGYLYPLGYIIGCAMIGAVLWGMKYHLFAPSAGRTLYLGLSCACAVVSLWAMMQFRATYDVSMLNWRLQRRRRASVLDDLEF
jgi:hypothetical protein